MTESNPHIRLNTSAEREAHFRVLAQTDNAWRDAMAMLDKARAEREAFGIAVAKCVYAACTPAIAQYGVRAAVDVEAELNANLADIVKGVGQQYDGR